MQSRKRGIHTRQLLMDSGLVASLKSGSDKELPQVCDFLRCLSFKDEAFSSSLFFGKSSKLLSSFANHFADFLSSKTLHFLAINFLLNISIPFTKVV